MNTDIVPGWDTSSLGVPVQPHERGLPGAPAARAHLPGPGAERGRLLTGLGGDVVQDSGQWSGLGLSQQAGGLATIDTNSLHVEQEVLVTLEVSARAELVTVLPLVIDDLSVRLELSGAPGWRSGELQLEGEWSVVSHCHFVSVTMSHRHIVT